MIIKTKRGYEVRSHSSGKLFGTYKTKAKASERLRQVKSFGGMK